MGTVGYRFRLDDFQMTHPMLVQPPWHQDYMDNPRDHTIWDFPDIREDGEPTTRQLLLLRARPFLKDARTVIFATIALEASKWNKARLAKVTGTILKGLTCLEEAYLRPFARVVSTSDGLHRSTYGPLLACYLLESVQIFTWPTMSSPCEICLNPTGSWCDSCDDSNAAICTECDSRGFCCQVCHSRGQDMEWVPFLYKQSPIPHEDGL